MASWAIDRLAPTVTESRSFSLGTAARLSVEIGAGTVRLRPADGEDIVVRRTVRHGWREPKLDEQSDGSEATIAASCPSFGGTCEIRYDVAVPDGLDVELSVSSGDVEVHGIRAQSVRTEVSSGRTTLVGVEAPLDVRSRAGAVDGTGLRSGHVVVDVSSGDTRLDFAAAPADVTVSASSGDVALRLPEAGSPYRVRTEISNGREQVDVPVDPGSPRSVAVSVSSGDVVVVPS
jgi:hypothetical protein